jgi:tetratricopeptide (TPR) repeat protein
METPGKLVSYDELITNIWGADSDVTQHTVVKTANDLKKCLDEYADCIQNQPGRGYYFCRPATPKPQTKHEDLDLDALTDFALGQEEWNRRTESSLRRALAYFRRVLVVYPNFAPARLGVANCLMLLAHAGFSALAPRSIFDEVKQSLELALKTSKNDIQIANAHATMAKFQLLFEWDLKQAERNFDLALAEDAASVAGYHGLAHVYLVRNEWDRSITAIENARRLEPSSPMLHGTAGWLLYLMNRPSDASAQCRRTIHVHPQFPAGYSMLGFALDAEERFGEAIEAFTAALELEPTPVGLAGLGHAYARNGNRRMANGAYNELARLKRTRVVNPFFFSIIHVGLGEEDEAMDGLEEAIEDRFDWILYLGSDPCWRPLQRRLRFARMLKRIGLYEFWAEREMLLNGPHAAAKLNSA